jgi:hypothetical protein
MKIFSSFFFYFVIAPRYFFLFGRREKFALFCFLMRDRTCYVLLRSCGDCLRRDMSMRDVLCGFKGGERASGDANGWEMG